MNIELIWKTYINSRHFEESNLKKEISRYNCHVLPYWQDKSLTDLKFIDIMAYRQYLENKNLSQQSVKHCLSLLKRSLNRAKQLDLFPYDIPYFEMPVVNNQRTRFLSESEILQLLHALKNRNKLWHDIVLFAIHTGMRAKEIFLLQPSSVNLSQRMITVHKTKNNKSRVIHLNDPLLLLVEPYYIKKMEYLFSDKLIKQPSKIFRETIKDLKLNENVPSLDRVVFHTLRHTFASQLLQRGLTIDNVSKLLGHSNLSMTMRYAHLSQQQGINAVNLLSDLHLP